jgi:hypothetical protein
MKRMAGAAAMAILSATASAQEFPSRAEAMDYIKEALPTATAANPSYLTKSSGAKTTWVTDEVSFAADVVTMREHFAATKDGKTVEARHEARFSVADVHIGPYIEVGDVTPTGAAAIGIAFACRTAGCVSAIWGDKPSHADSTDVYVQDLATRDRLLAAFRRLQTP